MKQVTVANVILLSEGQSEGGGSLKRAIGWCQEQRFWAKHLGKALTVLSLSCHSSCFDGSVDTMCIGPSYSSCSVWLFHVGLSSFLELFLFKTKGLAGNVMEGVSMHQMFTERPTGKS